MEQELYSKQDVLNAINQYLASLKRDIKNEKNAEIKHVLYNVFFSLEEISRIFRR